MIVVYHAKHPTFDADNLIQIRKDFHDGEYFCVSDVMTDDKEEAFRLTNHIDTAWTENEKVTPFTEKARSTSVGDIFVCKDAVYVVESHGFGILHYFDGYGEFLDAYNI